jgi:hypothetical protein
MYNFSLKISASIFFFILGLKYILDNTRFSIKANTSNDLEKGSRIKINKFADDALKKSNINNSTLDETLHENAKENLNYNSNNPSENKKDSKNNINNNNNNNDEDDNYNILKINSSAWDLEIEKEDEKEKSFIFYSNIESVFEIKKIFCLNAFNILLAIENILLCVVVLLLSSLLDKQKWFVNSESFKNTFLIESKINEAEFLENFISSIFAFLIAFSFAKLLNKFFSNKKITFYFGFLILIYLGVYSISNSVLNKKTYHLRKIMLSNQFEKNNPNVFLKKKDLELHFINNNSKLVKKKILSKKDN